MKDEKQLFKAFIRVVKSIGEHDAFGSANDVVKVPVIEAKDKAEVKEYLKNEYPQFFQNGKVYEKETKDSAQFFYVVIFPLYNHEADLINQGEWTCKQCGHVHVNRYESRPVTTQKPPFTGLEFCNYDTCYQNYKKEYWKDAELPDDESYIKKDSPSYIYKITEKSTGKCYIGKTRNAPFFRWWNHLKHSSSPFGLLLRQSKLSEWSFEVLEELAPDTPDTEVFRIESEYIVKFDSINNGFNTVISNKSVLAIEDTQGSLFDAA